MRHLDLFDFLGLFLSSEGKNMISFPAEASDSAEVAERLDLLYEGK